ncbi:hypothetical protein T07_2775, partial [Trichinella nelsoni]
LLVNFANMEALPCILRNGTGAPVYGLLIRQSGTNATAAATGGQHQHLHHNQQQLAASTATLAPAVPPAPTVLVQRDAAGINMRRVEPAPVGRRPYPVILPRRNNVTATPVNVNSLFIPTATVQQVHLQPGKIAVQPAPQMQQMASVVPPQLLPLHPPPPPPPPPPAAAAAAAAAVAAAPAPAAAAPTAPAPPAPSAAPQVPQAPALPQAQAISQTQQTAPMIASCHVNPTGAYHQTMSMDNSNHMLVDNSYGSCATNAYGHLSQQDSSSISDFDHFLQEIDSNDLNALLQDWTTDTGPTDLSASSNANHLDVYDAHAYSGRPPCRYQAMPTNTAYDLANRCMKTSHPGDLDFISTQEAAGTPDSGIQSIAESPNGGHPSPAQTLFYHSPPAPPASAEVPLSIEIDSAERGSSGAGLLTIADRYSDMPVLLPEVQPPPKLSRAAAPPMELSANFQPSNTGLTREASIRKQATADNRTGIKRYNGLQQQQQQQQLCAGQVASSVGSLHVDPAADVNSLVESIIATLPPEKLRSFSRLLAKKVMKRNPVKSKIKEIPVDQGSKNHLKLASNKEQQLEEEKASSSSTLSKQSLPDDEGAMPVLLAEQLDLVEQSDGSGSFPPSPPPDDHPFRGISPERAKRMMDNWLEYRRHVQIALAESLPAPANQTDGVAGPVVAGEDASKSWVQINDDPNSQNISVKIRLPPPTASKLKRNQCNASKDQPHHMNCNFNTRLMFGKQRTKHSSLKRFREQSTSQEASLGSCDDDDDDDDELNENMENWKYCPSANNGGTFKTPNQCTMPYRDWNSKI